MNADFIIAIGDLLLDSFALLRALGNGFNWLIIVIMFILGVVWVRRMAEYNREAKENGTLK